MPCTVAHAVKNLSDEERHGFTLRFYLRDTLKQMERAEAGAWREELKSGFFPQQGDRCLSRYPDRRNPPKPQKCYPSIYPAIVEDVNSETAMVTLMFLPMHGDQPVPGVKVPASFVLPGECAE